MLFADVRGYTRLTEQLQPAEVPALINRFYETASAALLGHDALLGQIEGDNVMALFVPGFAGPEYRRRAVDGAPCAPRSRRSVERARARSGRRDRERRGVHRQRGGGGYKDFTAVGDVTNMAARLTATAGAGEIVIDAETYAAVAATYPAAELRVLDLKGKSAPVNAAVLRS